jgi:hypothetical protein
MEGERRIPFLRRHGTTFLRRHGTDVFKNELQAAYRGQAHGRRSVVVVGCSCCVVVVVVGCVHEHVSTHGSDTRGCCELNAQSQIPVRPQALAHRLEVTRSRRPQRKSSRRGSAGSA